MSKIIDGTSLANKTYEKLQEKIDALKNIGKTPHLKIILVGDKKDSIVYTDMKRKRCEKMSIKCDVVKLPDTVNSNELIRLINEYNKDTSINGIMVQLPLPKTIRESTQIIIDTIHPDKDVDGLTSHSLGKLVSHMIEVHDLWNLNFSFSSTIYGIMKMIAEYDIDLLGKNVAVVGNSTLIGLPVSIILSKLGATVDICQIHTTNLKSHTIDKDIIIVGAGVKGLIKGDMVKKDVIVIDIGINVEIIENKRKISGDCDYETVSPLASLITPVPGGVGPMTICSFNRTTCKIYNCYGFKYNGIKLVYLLQIGHLGAPIFSIH